MTPASFSDDERIAELGYCLAPMLDKVRPSESASPPELKPCPFCGAFVERIDRWVRHTTGGNECPLTAKTFLATSWNRRSPSSDERPQREAVTDYAPGERLEQGVTFNAVDIWDAYAAGAKECRADPELVTDAMIQRACDAYVKLVHLNKGKASNV